MALADYSASSIQSLQAAIGGQVIAPKDPEYDAARTLVYGGFDLRPEAIVKVANVADVKHVIGFAREIRAPPCHAKWRPQPCRPQPGRGRVSSSIFRR